jgi:hypothetical protein
MIQIKHLSFTLLVCGVSPSPVVVVQVGVRLGFRDFPDSERRATRFSDCAALTPFQLATKSDAQ